MQFRIYGLLLLAAAALLLWYFAPTREGKLRYPKKYENYVGQIVPLTVVILIGLALPLIFFGAPGQLSVSGSSTQQF